MIPLSLIIPLEERAHDLTFNTGDTAGTSVTPTRSIVRNPYRNRALTGAGDRKGGDYR